MSCTIAPGVLMLALAFTSPQSPAPSRDETVGRQPQRRFTNAQQQSAPDLRGTDESPPAVEVQPAPKNNGEIAKGKQRENDAASARRWTIGLGVVTGLVGLLQVIAIGFQATIAHRQNRIIDGQTTIMREQAKHMAEGLRETQKAANAAEISANALKIIHRQWVQIGEWNFETWNIPKIGVDGRVTVDIVNRTSLPLTIFAVRCYVNGRKGGYSVADEMLPPDAHSYQTVTYLMDDKQLAQYETGGLRLVISGWVHYWDAFGDLQSQIIGVCLENLGPGKKPTSRGVAGLMRKMPRKEKDWPVQEMLDWMDKHDREKDLKGEW